MRAPHSFPLVRLGGNLSSVSSLVVKVDSYQRVHQSTIQEIPYRVIHLTERRCQHAASSEQREETDSAFHKT